MLEQSGRNAAPKQRKETEIWKKKWKGLAAGDELE
jgi:hypothetical protein